MKLTLLQAVLWIGAFVLLALLPAAVGLSGELPSGRGFWIEFGVLLGFLGLAVLNLQFVTTGRFRWFASGLGFDNLLTFHKQTGLFALLLVLAHPAVLIAARPSFLDYLNPAANLPRAVALGVVTIATLALVASSLWRMTFRLSYEKWRMLHGLLSLGILFIGVGHVLMVGHYSSPLWKKIAFVAMSGSAMYLVIHSRVVRPWRMRRNPYRIVEVRPQRNDAWTLVIEPEKAGPPLRFRAGQFVWITVGDSPYSLQQHPFSISSAPSGRRLELTIKELGDFTGTIGKVQPGTRTWLEGPYGCFSRDPDSGTPAVFIAGGVGITPVMSMLRDARERGSRTPLFLFHGNTAWEDAMFREEIAEMEGILPLKVIHVLTDPPADWDGESGYIDGDLLQRHLPANHREFSYFLCGPSAMLDLVEPTLRKAGIPAKAIHTERFNMV